MFLDPYQFPFAATLEANWRTIRAEMEALTAEQFTDWQGTYVKLEGKWTLFGFFLPGVRWEENCARCPETARILDAIPGATMAGFSRLVPGSHIAPHHGECGAILRMHLGLTVPESGCSLRVGNVTTGWQEGKTLLFDDTMEHESFNDSDRDRTVLIVDFYRPWRLRRSVVSFFSDRLVYRRRQRNAPAMRGLQAVTLGRNQGT